MFNILLVEDNPTDAELIITHLTRELRDSIHIKTVSTLAVARFELTQDYHLVLLDLNLPDSKGLETLENLRTTAPMVVISGVDISLPALGLGASAFVNKNTINWSDLPGIVISVLYQHKLRVCARCDVDLQIKRLADSIQQIHGLGARLQKIEEWILGTRSLSSVAQPGAMDVVDDFRRYKKWTIGAFWAAISAFLLGLFNRFLE